MALAPHDVHAGAEAKLYVPAAQMPQACASVPVLPAAEDFPAGQAEHEDADVAALCFLPATQGWSGWRTSVQQQS